MGVPPWVQGAVHGDSCAPDPPLQPWKRCGFRHQGIEGVFRNFDGQGREQVLSLGKNVDKRTIMIM